MPRFDVPMDQVRATTRIFDRGEYEIIVKNHQPFLRVRENNDGTTTDVAGVRYYLEMVGQVDAAGNVDEEFKGEQVQSLSVYVHTEGGQRGAKRFLMAVLGFDDEEAFNAEYAGKDFSVDGEGDAITVGAVWEEPVGKRFRATLDSEIFNDEEQQRFRNFRPL